MRNLYWRSIVLAAWLALLAWAVLHPVQATYDDGQASRAASIAP